MEYPLVSVIIPTFNRERAVVNAIESALAQTYPALEVIVVDDGSTDGTPRVFAGYGGRITGFRKENGGCSSARNYGIRRARGSFIALLDSDDVWFPRKIEKQMAALMNNPAAGLSICDMEYRDEATGLRSFSRLRSVIPADGHILASVLKLPPITCSYMVLRREVFEVAGYFDEKFFTANDFDLMLRVCSRFAVAVVNEPLLRYHRSRNSVSRRVSSGNRLRALDKLVRYAPAFVNEHAALLRHARARIHRGYARDLLWIGEATAAREQLRCSLTHRFSISSVTLWIKSLAVRRRPAQKNKGLLNIMFLNYSFDVGGIETLILDTCRALDSARYRLHVCSLQENNALEAEFKSASVRFHVIRKQRGIDLPLIFRLRRLLTSQQIDILHTHNAAQWIYGVCAVGGCRRPSLIHTQHSVIEGRHFLLRRAMRLLQKKTFSVVSVAQYVADYMVASAGVRPDKIKLIYNGVDIDRYQRRGDAAAKRKELGLADDELLVGIVARLVPVKCHAVLLDAFRQVTGNVPRARLLVVGSGELMEPLRRRAEELGIGQQVLFLGNRRDVPELLGILDLFVLSSSSEGLSMTLIEAMSSGLPVVATAVGGNGEIVVNHHTGLLVPAADADRLARAIEHLLYDRSAARTLGTNGIARSKELFSRELMIKEYIRLYEAAAGQ